MKRNRTRTPNQPKTERATRKRRARRERNISFAFVRNFRLVRLLEGNLGYTLLLTFVGLVYIFNSHRAESKAREVDALKKEIKALESEYMTLNAKMSVAYQQSRIATRVDTLGLDKPSEAPYKLVMVSEKGDDNNSKQKEVGRE